MRPLARPYHRAAVVVVVALAVTFFYFASSLCSLLPIANLLAETPRALPRWAEVGHGTVT